MAARSGIVRRGASGYTYDFGIAIARSVVSDLGILSAKALTLTAAIYGLSTTMVNMENSLMRNKIMFGGYLNTMKAMQFAQDKLLSGQTQFNSEDIMEGMRSIQVAGLNAKKTFDFVNKAAEATGQSFAEMGSMIEQAVNGGNFSQMVNLGIMTQNQTRYFERYTAGTNAMRSAVMRFMTSNKTLADAMKNTMTTIQGQLRRLKGFSVEFARAIVGDPTDPNSFYNQVKNAITMVNDYLKKNLPEIKKFAFAVGQVLGFIIRNTMAFAKYVAKFFARQIGTIRLFLGNFQHNILSMMLWLELVKNRIVSLWNQYKDEIKQAIKITLILWASWKLFSLFSAGMYAVGKAIRYSSTGLTLMQLLLPGLQFKLAKIKWAFREIWWATRNAYDSMILFARGFSFSSMISGLWASAAGAWSFTAAMLANPITWIVIAVVALVGWIAYLVTHWKQVRKETQGWSDNILLIVARFAPIIGIPLLLAKHWQNFKSIFINVWNTAKNIAIAVLLFIRNVTVDVALWILKKMQPVINMFRLTWAILKKAFSWIRSSFAPILNPIINMFRVIWTLVKDIFGWLKAIFTSDWIGSVLSKVGNFFKNTADASAKLAQTQVRAGDGEFVRKNISGGVTAQSETADLPGTKKIDKKKDSNPYLEIKKTGAGEISDIPMGVSGGGSTFNSGAIVINVYGSKANPEDIAKEVMRMIEAKERSKRSRQGA